MKTHGTRPHLHHCCVVVLYEHWRAVVGVGDCYHDNHSTSQWRVTQVTGLDSQGVEILLKNRKYYNNEKKKKKWEILFIPDILQSFSTKEQTNWRFSNPHLLLPVPDPVGLPRQCVRLWHRQQRTLRGRRQWYDTPSRHWCHHPDPWHGPERIR